jgi:enterochelin esterase-like enzyme
MTLPLPKKIMKKLSVIIIAYIAFQFSGFNANAQSGVVVADSLYGKSLAKNISGEKITRHLLIYLPPSYAKNPGKHYPVIYLLHGIGDIDSVWVNHTTDLENIGSVIDYGIHQNRFGEMIVVMPDEKTNWFGSFYVNSSATGNWEDFTTGELINYIDKKYRTLAESKSRAIAGHSMGGYGAITLGMKHPDIFSIVYAMNPAIIDFTKDLSPANPTFQQVLQVVLNAKVQTDLFKGGRLGVGMLTVAQAFSPNADPKHFFADFPFKFEQNNVVPDEPAYSRWKANFPIEMLGRYQANLRKLRALRFESGYEDDYLFIPTACREFSEKLSAYNIDHIFEEYNGDHRNRMWGKNGRLLNEMLPYIWFNFAK